MGDVHPQPIVSHMEEQQHMSRSARISAEDEPSPNFGAASQAAYTMPPLRDSNGRRRRRTGMDEAACFPCVSFDDRPPRRRRCHWHSKEPIMKIDLLSKKPYRASSCALILLVVAMATMQCDTFQAQLMLRQDIYSNRNRPHPAVRPIKTARLRRLLQKASSKWKKYPLYAQRRNLGPLEDSPDPQPSPPPAALDSSRQRSSRGGGGGMKAAAATTKYSLPLSSLLRLEESSRRLEGQVRQLTTVVQALQQTVGDNIATAPASVSSSNRKKKRARLLIDGTWLYYSLYGREGELCPIARKFGIDWVLRYAIDWSRIPAIVEEHVSNELKNAAKIRGGGSSSYWIEHQRRPSPPPDDGSDGIEIASCSVFTSYRPDTAPTSLRYKMFEEMSKADRFEVHRMETLGDAEKCVDIALAVELLRSDCDAAFLLTGDRDFVPAMIGARSPTKKLGLVSMRRGCNRALYEKPPGVIMDYNVIWLDDYVEKFVVPISSGNMDSGAYGGGSPLAPAVVSTDGRHRILSLYTFIKILNDFIEHSPTRRVSSRDVGRYFKSLSFDYSTTVSDEVKSTFGSLRQVVRLLSDVYKIEDGTSDELSDRSFWIELASTATQRLQVEAEKAVLSPTETRFFDQYSLRILEDKKTIYAFTIALTRGANGDESANESADRPIEDYGSWKVSQLKDLCRELGLPVSGAKAVLVDRIEASERERRRREEIEELRAGADKVAPYRPPYIRAIIPQEVSQYLRGLVVEYLRASGGRASSRNVGRYLAANKSMKGSSGQTALQDLKRFYSSVAHFIQMHPQTFSRDDLGSDASASKIVFSVYLKDEVHTNL